MPPSETPQLEARHSTFRWKRIASAGMIVGGGCLVIVAFFAFIIRQSEPPQFYLADNALGIALFLGGLVAVIAGAIGWTTTGPGPTMFRFTIRDVLWLTLVVAIGVCWGLDRVQFRREQVNARRAELRVRMEAQRAQENAELARAMERAAAAKLPATTAP